MVEGSMTTTPGRSAVAPGGRFGLTRRPDDLPHRAHIVAGEGGHGSSELAVLKELEQRVEKLGAVILIGDNEVVPFVEEGDEAEVERGRRRTNAQPGVGPARGDSGGDTEVRIFLAVIAVDRRRRNAQAPQVIVQKDTRPGAPLPIDEDGLSPGELLQTVQVKRIAGGGDQTLLAPDEGHDRRRDRSEE